MILPLRALLLAASFLAVAALGVACASSPTPTPIPTIFPTPTPFPIRAQVVKFATEIAGIERERDAWQRGWELFSKNIRDYTSPALSPRYQALRREYDPLLERLGAIRGPELTQVTEVRTRLLAAYTKEKEALDTFESLLLTKNIALLDQVNSLEAEAARTRSSALGAFSALLLEHKISAAEINP